MAGQEIMSKNFCRFSLTGHCWALLRGVHVAEEGRQKEDGRQSLGPSHDSGHL